MLTHYAVPMGQVVYMPTVTVAFVAVCLCMVESYGVAIMPA